MARIRIPASQIGPLERLAAMSDERYAELEAYFGPIEGDLTRQAVADRVAAVIDNAGEAEALLDAVLGACAFGRGAGLKQESAATEIAGSDLLELDDAEQKTLAARLEALFRSPTLELLAHAVSLRAEDEFTYCTSRILSDLRPIFGRDEEPTSTAALIRHTLKFDVHINGRLESVLISVDDRALQEIAAGVERAIRKSETLVKIAHDAGLRVVDLGEVH